MLLLLLLLMLLLMPTDPVIVPSSSLCVLLSPGRKMDRRSKSDPFVVAKWKTDTDDTWKEIGESPV